MYWSRLPQTHLALPATSGHSDVLLTSDICIFHGDDNSVVYLHHSQKFVGPVETKLPETKVRFDIADGKDHAFDMDIFDWDSCFASKDANDFLTKSWLDLAPTLGADSLYPHITPIGQPLHH